MSKYLKLFNQDAEYHRFKETEEYILPNVSYIKADNIVYYNPHTEAKPGVIMARYNATEENKLALADTSNVKSLKVNGENVEFGDMYYFNEVGEYDVEIELIDPTLINGVIYDENESAISNSMFCESESWVGACLTSVILPEGITTIGDDAFEDCDNLAAINIPNSVTSIGENAFICCYSLTSITIPDSVTSIGYYAFYDCTSLPVEDNLRYADTYLVGAVDTTLSTCIIKDGTKWIGDDAFYECSNLTSAVIPDSVTSIGYYAFSGCSSLTSIVIPDSVTSIGNYAFEACSSLSEITCNAITAPTIDYTTFQMVKEGGVLKVPVGSDYSSWMNQLNGYNWTIEYIIPENAKILEIPYDEEGNARQTEELFNLVYANLGEENVKNNVYADTSVSVKEATGYDYIRYTRDPEYIKVFVEIIGINAYSDRISIGFGNRIYSYHFSNNSYETVQVPW